jgi:hypothetical protein
MGALTAGCAGTAAEREAQKAKRQAIIKKPNRTIRSGNRLHKSCLSMVKISFLDVFHLLPVGETDSIGLDVAVTGNTLGIKTTCHLLKS